MKDNYVEFKAIKAFACYFINGDADSVTEDEAKKADAYIEKLRKEFGNRHIDVDIDDGDCDCGRCEIIGLHGDRATFRYVITGNNNGN